LLHNHLILGILVYETTWTDVFDAGIGGQRTQQNREEPRVPSAYLLVYVNADQKSLYYGLCISSKVFLRISKDEI
jgi:hypothetical protein